MVVDDRERQIIENIGLVHSIAKRFTNRGAEYDDIFQAGCVGLIKAVDNFDNSRGYMFSTYAVPVIIGEIKRLFRDGGSVKVSRTIKEKAIQVQKLRDNFITSKQREPKLSELSQLSGIDISELSEIISVSTPTISLSVDSEESGEELDIPVDDSESLFNKLTVSCLLSKLDGKDRKLIYLRFFEGKTQCEVAKMLNISQVQVSRKEKSILQGLRHNLRDC